jgi:hypothetical protein
VVVQEHQVHQEARGQVALLVHRVLMEQAVFREQTEHQVLLALLEQMVLQELVERMVHLEVVLYGKEIIIHH